MDATTTFEAWALPNPVRDALSRQGIVTPTQIQTQAIPAALDGKDLFGHAINGTGKTLAFCLPLISLLDKDENRDKIGLVLTPNDDVAVQVHDTIKKLTSKMTGRWKPVLVIDDANVGAQEEGLRKRPRMIVATPARLVDHINSGIAKLDNVKFVVMEEADRMLESGLDDQIGEIMQTVPSERQTMMFTTSVSKDVEKLGKKHLQSPEKVEGGEANIPEKVAPVNNSENEETGRFDALIKGLEAREGTVIAFCRTKFRARRLAQRLFKAGHPTDCIHSDRSQNQKQNTIKAFDEGQFRVLVATDIAIGSVELAAVKHIVNFDVQEFPKEFNDLVENKDETVSWVSPESPEAWLALQKVIGEGGQARVAEIQKQKAIARENGELPERPRHKKKSNKPNNKNRRPNPNSTRPINDNYADEDDDSQIFFQPSVEEQLNQLDTMIKKKVRNPHARPNIRGNYAGNSDDNFGNRAPAGTPGPNRNRKKRPNSGGRGGRNGGNGNGYY